MDGDVQRIIICSMLYVVGNMKEQYLNYKKDYNDYILLIKKGNFYISLNNDAYIINKIFNYKIIESTNFIKTGFPLNNIEKIK